MKTSRVPLLGAVLAIVILAPSCVHSHRTAKTGRIPPVKPSPSPTPVVYLPAPPQTVPEHADLSQTPPIPAGQLPPPPHQHKHVMHAQPVQQSQPAPGEQASEQTDAPQLEQMLSPAESQKYNATIDRNIRNARQKLDALNGGHLSSEQKIYLDRIRAFIEQANEARQTDLFRAESLSRRAIFLAEDLLRSVR